MAKLKARPAARDEVEDEDRARGAAEDRAEEDEDEDEDEEAGEEGPGARKERVLTRSRVEKLVAEAGVGNVAAAKTLHLEDLGADRVAPKALQAFTGLYKLLLQSNKLSSLPKRVFAPGVPSTLTFLDLSQNQLGDDCLQRLGHWHLDKLVTLKLAGNRLTRFSSAPFARMKQLAALVLNDNALERLEFADQALPALNTLIVSGNKLEALDDTSGLDQLPNLKKLSASKNALRAIPDVRGCPLLAELRLSNNAITSVDGAILMACPKLAVLDVSSNEIAKPKALEFLKALAPSLIHFSMAKNPVADKLIKAARKEGGPAAEDKLQLARALVSRYFKDAPRLKTCDGVSLAKAGIATATSATSARQPDAKTPASARNLSKTKGSRQETAPASKSGKDKASEPTADADRPGPGKPPVAKADTSVSKTESPEDIDVGARSGVAAVIVEAGERRKRSAKSNTDKDRARKRSKPKASSSAAAEDEDGVKLSKPTAKTWAVSRKVDAW